MLCHMYVLVMSWALKFSLQFSVAVQKQHQLLKEAGVNPFDTVLMSVVQLTVQFGFFIGLRRMCQLPVEQLKYGGLGFLTDLTLPDPYYITPIICTALVNLQLSVRRFCSNCAAFTEDRSA